MEDIRFNSIVGYCDVENPEAVVMAASAVAAYFPHVKTWATYHPIVDLPALGRAAFKAWEMGQKWGADHFIVRDAVRTMGEVIWTKEAMEVVR